MLPEFVRVYDVLPQDVAPCAYRSLWGKIDKSYPNGQSRVFLEHALPCADVLARYSSYQAAYD